MAVFPFNEFVSHIVTCYDVQADSVLDLYIKIAAYLRDNPILNEKTIGEIVDRYIAENPITGEFYSALNPPPYPVTSVNGQNGAVRLNAFNVDALAANGTAVDSRKLGGNPPEFYLTANGTAVNSSKLGGNPPEFYLAANGKAADSSKLGGQLPSFYATEEDIAPLLYNNAGAHNAVYRGKDLGTAVTSTQWDSISAGTFDGMYVGDFWTIGGITYRIAAFDYYYNTGDTKCLTHHVTIVPDSYIGENSIMNDTNITTGAYVGSKMYAEGLNNTKNIISAAFGPSHILNHRQYLQNAVTNGYASAASWYDSTVELMTEQNVYGCKIFGNVKNGTTVPNNQTLDNSQYPLFRFNHSMVSNGRWFWLRDVASDTQFSRVDGSGYAYFGNASLTSGIRPAFSIC